MATTLTIPRPEQLETVLAVLGSWHREGGSFALHPGDLGWHHLHGAETTTAYLRLWQRAGETIAVGLLDCPDLVRTAVDPGHAADDELARTMAADLLDPSRGVLPEGQAYVEAHSAHRLRAELSGHGWVEGEPWIPLRRGLGSPVPEPQLMIEPVEIGTAGEYAAVHRSAFASSGVTAERLVTMATGPAHREAASLPGRDRDAAVVAVITVWSAGAGRPGLIEPMGVHADHRGRGHGRAITLAGAAQLRRMGASSALVCTPRSRPGAVETYLAAGFTAQPDVPDLQRHSGV